MWIIIVIFIVLMILLTIGLNIKISDIMRIKKLASDEKLNNINKKLPANLEICKNMLIILKNKDVKIEESKNTKDSLYLVMKNKIIIANISDSFMRVQTIAHECIHSIQNKKILKFNYFYSNVYLLSGFIFLILILTRIINSNLIFLISLIIYINLSVIYYVIRNFLEMDAMIRAKYLSQNYLSCDNKLNNDEIETIINKYAEINGFGIKLYSFLLLIKCIFKILILTLVMLIW